MRSLTVGRKENLMLPKTGNLLEQNFNRKVMPSKAYRIGDGRIDGYTDQLEAVKQASRCILSTERYDWLIYSWNYGIESKELMGQPLSVVKSKIKKRIKEALMQDQRILGIDAFSFQEKGRNLGVVFTIHTVFGDFEAYKEVET